MNVHGGSCWLLAGTLVNNVVGKATHGLSTCQLGFLQHGVWIALIVSRKTEKAVLQFISDSEVISCHCCQSHRLTHIQGEHGPHFSMKECQCHNLRAWMRDYIDVVSFRTICPGF